MIQPANLTDSHWVIVDGFELLEDGKEFVKIRDPGTGDAWHVPYQVFADAFAAPGSHAISF